MKEGVLNILLCVWSQPDAAEFTLDGNSSRIVANVGQREPRCSALRLGVMVIIFHVCQFREDEDVLGDSP